MPSLAAAIAAQAAVDPLYALIAAGTFGKVTYLGGDNYHIHAADNNTILCAVRARQDNAGNLTLIRVIRGSTGTGFSANAAAPQPGLVAPMKAAFAADPVQLALAAGNFGNVTANGNGTYSVNTLDNSALLCTFTGVQDNAGNFVKGSVLRRNAAV